MIRHATTATWRPAEGPGGGIGSAAHRRPGHAAAPPRTGYGRMGLPLSGRNARLPLWPGTAIVPERAVGPAIAIVIQSCTRDALEHTLHCPRKDTAPTR